MSLGTIITDPVCFCARDLKRLSEQHGINHGLSDRRLTALVIAVDKVVKKRLTAAGEALLVDILKTFEEGK